MYHMLRSSQVYVVLYLIQKQPRPSGEGDDSEEEEDEQVVRLLGQTEAVTARAEVTWLQQQKIISEVQIYRWLTIRPSALHSRNLLPGFLDFCWIVSVIRPAAGKKGGGNQGPAASWKNSILLQQAVYWSRVGWGSRSSGVFASGQGLHACSVPPLIVQVMPI